MPSSPTPDSPPRWLWIATFSGVTAVIAIIAATALLIASGATDHPVAGPVVWSDSTFAWAGGPQIAFDTESGQWWSAPFTLSTPDAFTLTVRATFAADAGPLAAWGIWLAADGGSRALYAISAGGYWTIRACPADPPPTAIEDCPALHPAWRWSPFPRIHASGTANTLTLHREPDGTIRLRVNHELLGAPPLALTGTWGLWARGGSGAVLHWDRAEMRRPAAGE